MKTRRYARSKGAPVPLDQWAPQDDVGLWDVMAPVGREDGSTVWIKVGIFTPKRGASAQGDYLGTVSLLTLPVGAVAPLRLYVYPRKGAA